jgi:hypothetical protein
MMFDSPHTSAPMLMRGNSLVFEKHLSKMPREPLKRFKIFLFNLSKQLDKVEARDLAALYAQPWNVVQMYPTIARCF